MGPLRGATFTVKAIIGFRVTGETPTEEEKKSIIGPGVLGSEVETPSIRVDGVRLNRGWIASAIEAIMEPDSAQDLTTLAILSHVVPLMQHRQVEGAGTPEAAAAVEKKFGDRQLEEDAAVAIAEAYAKVDAASRAWLLSVMPRRSPSLSPGAHHGSRRMRTSTSS